MVVFQRLNTSQKTEVRFLSPAHLLTNISNMSTIKNLELKDKGTAKLTTIAKTISLGIHKVKLEFNSLKGVMGIYPFNQNNDPTFTFNVDLEGQDIDLEDAFDQIDDLENLAATIIVACREGKNMLKENASSSTTTLEHLDLLEIDTKTKE